LSASVKKKKDSNLSFLPDWALEQYLYRDVIKCRRQQPLFAINCYFCWSYTSWICGLVLLTILTLLESRAVLAAVDPLRVGERCASPHFCPVSANLLDSDKKMKVYLWLKGKDKDDTKIICLFTQYLFFYYVFRATRGKTTPPCPLLLTKQGGSIQCMIFISCQTCNMILHTVRYHQIYITTLREDI
jgi:hypothetical protein